MKIMQFFKAQKKEITNSNILDWEKLLSSNRRKNPDKTLKKVSVDKTDRTEIERDYDRIVFSAPVRRLSNKTQVFPLDENDTVRTRLTHSHEVSNLARGAGVSLCCNGFFNQSDVNDKRLLRDIPSLLATSGLVHDLGNPPFGHQGEEAIRVWFKKHLADKYKDKTCTPPIYSDFIHFDGNAQTFRLVTRLHAADGDYGMDLTYATLATIIKYPSLNNNLGPYKKAGIFYSEKEIAEDIWRHTGLNNHQRHPLTFIMEICDDIAYATIDVEDTIKKGYASFNDLKTWIISDSSIDKDFFESIYKTIDDKIADFNSRSEDKLTSDTTREVSMEIFRSIVINKLLSEATNKFNEDFISDSLEWKKQNEPSYYEISDNFKHKNELKCLKKFTAHYGFNNKEVLKLELSGGHYIKKLMDALWLGFENIDENLKGQNHYQKYIISLISKNYLREFKRAFKECKENKRDQELDYYRYQLMTDYISGMTENFLIRMHNEIIPLYENHISSR